MAALVFMKPDEEERDGASWLRDAMWSGALAQLGGEHAALARFPGDHNVVIEQMESLWEAHSDELHRRIDALGDPETTPSSRPDGGPRGV